MMLSSIIEKNYLQTLKRKPEGGLVGLYNILTVPVCSSYMGGVLRPKF